MGGGLRECGIIQSICQYPSSQGSIYPQFHNLPLMRSPEIQSEERVHLWECCDVPARRAYGNSCSTAVLSTGATADWPSGVSLTFIASALIFPCRQTKRITSDTVCVHTHVRKRLCAAAIVPLSARASSAQTGQFPESSLTLVFSFLFWRSPFIFLRPVSFKETDRTKEFENKKSAVFTAAARPRDS